MDEHRLTRHASLLSNITAGRPGTPLALRLFVVDASTCKPIAGAVVDIWHADALGVYSGFGPGSGNRTFMRGAQRTDANGLARFRTVYPGCTAVAPSTSTSRCTSPATSSTPGSSTSPTR
ncbi:MAG TPA: hypothetical protein VE753_10205 [Gaiellaceae bacterium]|jgi:protocatechuate 3,4-dioxygenase beta subunit|nr:hypothetical protein [Gaiellaceae bacterium]